MATFTTVEDVTAWQKARELTRQVYTASGRGLFGRDFGLRDQIRRAAVSIMANVAEGFERDGTGEFVQFLSVAKGSVGELRAHLYVALDQLYVTKQEFERMRVLADETARLISGLMAYLRRSQVKGLKYKAVHAEVAAAR